MNNADQAKDLFAKAKKAAVEGVDKVKKAAAENPDKVRGGIDKVAGAANSVTKGKYADKIQDASNKVEDAVQKTAAKPTPGAEGTTGTTGTYGAESGRKPGHVPDPVDEPGPIDPPAPIR
ncbi:antitoxin [Yimella sp. cx-51]|uniref:antitoxin n=1 Tax=Yimella sp. cx-51 TaxID=2770551 RepID=UPI00165EA863|nr:antitoxin [Yimella sp. cx-51]MBC9957719.1 antitoxin [Yimella sp. cx-51]QTH36931.1 antitoxin [Yimella sp. cx-51]